MFNYCIDACFPLIGHLHFCRVPIITIPSACLCVTLQNSWTNLLKIGHGRFHKNYIDISIFSEIGQPALLLLWRHTCVYACIPIPALCWHPCTASMLCTRAQLSHWVVAFWLGYGDTVNYLKHRIFGGTDVSQWLCFPTHLITNTITLELKVYVNIHIIKVCSKLHKKEQLCFPVLLQMFIWCEI